MPRVLTAETIYACEACGQTFVRLVPRCLKCGRDAVAGREASPEDAPADKGPRLVRLDARSDATYLPCASAIGEACGGRIREGALVLVHGAPGAGKSTEVARAVAALRGAVWWASAASETDRGETVETFERAGVWPRPLRARLLWYAPPERDGRALRKLVDAEGREGVHLVLDSLQAWARTADQQRDLLRRLRGGKWRSCWIIARENAEGRAAGVRDNEHEVDAVVRVERAEVRQEEKCRWSAPRTAQRPPLAADGADAPRARRSPPRRRSRPAEAG